MNTLEKQANKLLEASGFNTYFSTETRAFSSGLYLETRQTGELTARGNTVTKLDYLDVLTTLDFYETAEGKAVLAEQKALQAKRNKRVRNEKVSAERKAANAARKALRALKRS